MKYICFSLLFFPGLLFASDHIDGLATISNSVADLSDLYAFPTKGKKDSLSVVLNTYPVVAKSGHFSDKVSYNFILRGAKVDGEGDGSRVGTDKNTEVTISCSFQTPATTTRHTMTCTGPNGLRADVRYNEVEPKKPGNDFPAFAGMRTDSFFFDGLFAKNLANKNSFNRIKGLNAMAGTNVLSIALDLDLKKIFGENPPKMVAVAAESVTTDPGKTEPRRIDRVGRPEITNVSLVAHGKDPDLRNEYNLDRPFEVSAAQAQKYRHRLEGNIAVYDQADEHTDWKDKDRKHLAALLTDDFLVVDTSKPCGDSSFLEIEKSMIAHKEHKSCGGRRPNEDIMDKLFGLYVGGLDGKDISDGVDHPSKPATDAFPYLADPSLHFTEEAFAALKRKLIDFQKRDMERKARKQGQEEEPQPPEASPVD